MKLTDMANTLRATSGRYGGIQHYLEAAEKEGEAR